MSQTQQVPKLIITFDEKGEVIVTGPLEQKLLCYGMLKAAEMAIASYKASPIQKPSPADMKRVIN
jgi:hypothetical protein